MVSSTETRSLAAFNDAPDDERLRADLAACCAARDWVAALLAGRPFADQDELFDASDAATASLSDAGIAEALGGHPRIGDRPSGEWSRQEQSGVSAADAETHAKLAAANGAYEQRFGQIYLVCASGRSAEELLAVCESRLANDSATERGVLLGELAKINRIRLGKLLPEGDSE
jgi:2-oxo-4-hydroxy-4-carboxy-5-ureidoimidazoline decarboxylase